MRFTIHKYVSIFKNKRRLSFFCLIHTSICSSCIDIQVLKLFILVLKLTKHPVCFVNSELARVIHRKTFKGNSSEILKMSSSFINNLEFSNSKIIYTFKFNVAHCLKIYIFQSFCSHTRDTT